MWLLIFLAASLPKDLFGLWLLNNDEMWDNVVPNTKIQTNVYVNYGSTTMVFDLPTPVPTFSGRWAIYCQRYCYTQVDID